MNRMYNLHEVLGGVPTLVLETDDTQLPVKKPTTDDIGYPVREMVLHKSTHNRTPITSEEVDGKLVLHINNPNNLPVVLGHVKTLVLDVDDMAIVTKNSLHLNPKSSDKYLTADQYLENIENPCTSNEEKAESLNLVEQLLAKISLLEKRINSLEVKHAKDS